MVSKVVLASLLLVSSVAAHGDDATAFVQARALLTPRAQDWPDHAVPWERPRDLKPHRVDGIFYLEVNDPERFVNDPQCMVATRGAIATKAEIEAKRVMVILSLYTGTTQPEDWDGDTSGHPVRNLHGKASDPILDVDSVMPNVKASYSILVPIINDDMSELAEGALTAEVVKTVMAAPPIDKPWRVRMAELIQANIDALFNTYGGDGSYSLVVGSVQAPRIQGDPHVTNVHGEHFDILTTGSYKLLEIPRDHKGLASESLISISGTVAQPRSDCRSMWIRHLTLAGKLLGQSYEFLAAPDWKDETDEGTFLVTVGNTTSGTPMEFASLAANAAVELYPDPKTGWQKKKHKLVKIIANMKIPAGPATLNVNLWKMPRRRLDKGAADNHLDLDVKGMASLLNLVEGGKPDLIGGLLGSDDHKVAAASGCTEADPWQTRGQNNPRKRALFEGEEQDEEEFVGSFLTLQ